VVSSNGRIMPGAARCRSSKWQRRRAIAVSGGTEDQDQSVLKWPWRHILDEVEGPLFVCEREEVTMALTSEKEVQHANSSVA